MVKTRIEKILSEADKIKFGDYLIITRTNRTKWYTSLHFDRTTLENMFIDLKVNDDSYVSLILSLCSDIRYNEKIITSMDMILPPEEFNDITNGLRNDSYYINPKYKCEPFNVILDNGNRVKVIAKVIDKYFYISDDLKTMLVSKTYTIDNTDENLNLIDNL